MWTEPFQGVVQEPSLQAFSMDKLEVWRVIWVTASDQVGLRAGVARGACDAGPGLLDSACKTIGSSYR